MNRKSLRPTKNPDLTKTLFRRNAVSALIMPQNHQESDSEIMQIISFEVSYYT